MKRCLVCIAVALLASGCATYRTPGAGIDVGDLSRTDEDIAQVMKRQPAAHYPARLAVVRAQAPGYYSRGHGCYGRGRYCVSTTRDSETERSLERIVRLPMISAVAPMSQILLPPQLESVRDLRRAAAQLRTDILLLYSVDTRFNIESTDIGPLALISLGFIPNKKAQVTSTASAALIDVRSGFVYGVAEASATQQQRATMWSSEEAVDSARLKTEADALEKLLGEFEKLWKAVVEEHARTSPQPQLATRD
jgi:hypothetical protein